METNYDQSSIVLWQTDKQLTKKTKYYQGNSITLILIPLLNLTVKNKTIEIKTMSLYLQTWSLNQ